VAVGGGRVPVSRCSGIVIELVLGYVGIVVGGGVVGGL